MSKSINNKNTNINKKFVLKTKTTPPSSRAGHSYISSSSGLINYVIGGYSNEETFTDIYKYNNNIWSKISSLTSYTNTNSNPFPRMEFDCCCLGDNIYLFAGMQFEGEQVLILNDLWMFDSIKLKWNLIEEETVVSERAGHVMVAINEHSFIIYGGECMQKPCNDMWLYSINSSNTSKGKSVGDTAAGVWTRIASYSDQPIGNSTIYLSIDLTYFTFIYFSKSNFISDYFYICQVELHILLYLIKKLIN
jgi:N-acetylneuraminic acid mutarotase